MGQWGARYTGACFMSLRLHQLRHSTEWCSHKQTNNPAPHTLLSMLWSTQRDQQIVRLDVGVQDAGCRAGNESRGRHRGGQGQWHMCQENMQQRGAGHEGFQEQRVLSSPPPHPHTCVQLLHGAQQFGSNVHGQALGWDLQGQKLAKPREEKGGGIKRSTMAWPGRLSVGSLA